MSSSLSRCSTSSLRALQRLPASEVAKQKQINRTTEAAAQCAAAALRIPRPIATPPAELLRSQLFANTPSIFSNGCSDNLAAIVQTAIASARTALHLQAYRLSCKQTIACLEKQIKEGVPTTIQYQYFGEADRLSLSSNVCLTPHPRNRRVLMHHKNVLVDNQLAVIGTANFTVPSFQSDMNVTLSLQSTELCECIKSGSSGSFKIQEQDIQCFTIPEHKETACAALLALIQAAEARIQIAMYALTHAQLLKALHHAYQRGVSVEIVIDPEVHTLTLEHLTIMNSKLPIRRKTGEGKLHCKMAIIDQKIFVTGSANWTLSGLNRNRETLIILQDLTTPQHSKLQHLWNSILTQSEDIFPKPSSGGGGEEKDLMEKRPIMTHPKLPEEATRSSESPL